MEEDKNYKRFTNEINKATRNMHNSRFNPSDPNIMTGSEVFNMNNGYNLIILRFMEEYTFCSRFNANGRNSNKDWFYSRISILQHMKTFLAPKMRLKNMDLYKAIKTRLLNARKKIPSIFEETSTGNYYSYNKATELSEEIDDLMEDFVFYMNQIGMLTQAKDDPKIAFGDYSD